MVLEPVYIEQRLEPARPQAALMPIATVLISGAGARRLHFLHFKW